MTNRKPDCFWKYMHTYRVRQCIHVDCDRWTVLTSYLLLFRLDEWWWLAGPHLKYAYVRWWVVTLVPVMWLESQPGVWLRSGKEKHTHTCKVGCATYSSSSRPESTWLLPHSLQWRFTFETEIYERSLKRGPVTVVRFTWIYYIMCTALIEPGHMAQLTVWSCLWYTVLPGRMTT